MNTTPTDEAESELLPEDGVGRYLRKMREALELSRAEVAAGLYLHEKMVAALEEDDQEALPGPVFVQGYLRKYARLLNIPEAPLLQAYNRQMVPRKHRRKEEGPLAGSPIRPEIRSNHTLVRLVTWGMALGLLALVAVWWQGDMGWPGEEPAEGQPAAVQQEAPLPSISGDPPAPADPSAEVAASEFPGAVDPEPAPRMESGPVTTAQDQPPAETAPGEVAIAALPARPLELDQVLDGATETAPDTGNEARSEAPPAGGSGSDSETPLAGDTEQAAGPANDIVITFSETCWTEIRGADGSYKLIGNMPKGARHRLGGEPPYTFVLGNSAAVTLTINGQPFDIEAHTRNNIARFTLQPEDIPTP